MTTSTYTTPIYDTAPGGHSLFETFLVIVLLAMLSAGAWYVFGQMPAYGGQPTPPPVNTLVMAPAPAPLCFDRTREQVIAQGAEAGCPTDPMAYHPATLRANQG
ncbi:hypothetical protein [Dyella sp. 2HG41-7]|uniref:hypothetical protein n=1 Tax=Dyella sp. 2HG41-7 TaxID=2883239 RepID=UPI001F1980A5|nr:hypothetical protein [Dyella sp. 2HG41-7]